MKRLLESFIETLEQTERLEPERLARYQARLLVRLAQYCHESVPFYASGGNLGRFGHDAGSFDWDAWRALPRLGRAEIERCNGELEARPLPAEQRPTWERRTSGTTGRRVRVLHGLTYTLSFHALVQRLYRWTGADPRGRYASLRIMRPGTAEYPEGLTLDAWDEGSAVLGIAGTHRIIDIRTDPADQARWLQKERPDCLFTTPRNLLRVAEESIRLGLGVRIPIIHTGREPMTDGIRALAEEAFGAIPSHNYGSAECGHIAQYCLRCRAYHIHADNILVEVLRDDGNPCKPGELGRVVMTQFYEYAMPLLRYDIGDMAIAGGPSECEIALPTIKEVVGKAAHMPISPDGQLCWPGDLSGLVFRHFGTRRFQLAQTGPNAFELRLVRIDGLPSGADAFRNELNQKLGFEAVLSVDRCDEIDFAASAKRWDLVNESA